MTAAPHRHQPGRFAPLTGLAGIACIVGGLASDRAPTSSWSDARIQRWYTTHGLGVWFLSAYLLALGAPLVLVFTAVVRERLRRAGAGRVATTVVSGSGVAFAVTVLVGAGLYAAVPAAMTFTHAPAPTAAVSRFLLGAAYGVLVMFSAFAAALFALAVSVTALRTRALPRWLAIAGIPLSAIMLANAVLPMGAITLWFLVVPVAFSVRQTRPDDQWWNEAGPLRPTEPASLTSRSVT